MLHEPCDTVNSVVVDGSFSGDETELDLSEKGLTAGCAVLVANEIKNNGALAKLNISNNYIGYGGDMSGVKALAAAIPECR